MTKEWNSVPPDIQELATTLRQRLMAESSSMSDDQRMAVLEKVFDLWCKLCGGPMKCYCSAAYDE